MRILLAAPLLFTLLLNQHTASASCVAAPPPPPPPPQVPDWYNVLIMVDVTGSMADPHATVPTPITKLQQALIQAKNHVLEMQAKTNMEGKPLNLALWAFDSSFPSPSFITKVIDFIDFKSPAAVLQQLGFDALGNPSGSPNPIFTPRTGTPLAGAVCSAVGQVAANFDASNNPILPGGFQWGAMTGGQPAKIRRMIFVESDGLENATPSTGECFGTTSTSTDYLCYEPGTWQYAVRNKLQTGNATNATLSTSNTGLIFNVDYIFTNTITGAARVSGESALSLRGGATLSTAPTLAQGDTFFKGVTKMTNGTYRTVTVAANGTTSARRPGDINGNGCVDNTDYNLLSVYYGQICAGQAACIAADLNGDNAVDFSDYLILTGNFGAGC